MNKTQYLTEAGKRKVEEELANLRGPQRAEIAARLKSAIEMGDLSENADYHAAKEAQGFLEGRIQELESLLYYAEIVDESEFDIDVVNIGSKVTVQEAGEDEEVYIIVGAKEANVRERKISYESPMGASLLGKKCGETVDVPLPNGNKLNLKIIAIE
ncbi:MAG TPA: transcription elongation factor GreA [Anaerolineaceae bacterium]|jgi:transcription elongation factor GreA|nr:transcription elongation factor GreA [Anaerolineaceae bacterium]